MQYLVQQLTPLVRRIHACIPTDNSRLADPAFGDWARARLDTEQINVANDLADALKGTPVPLTRLEKDSSGQVHISINLMPGEHLWGACDADASGLDRRGDHVHLVNELHPRGQHLMVDDCDLCGADDVDETGLTHLDIGGSSNYAELCVPFVISSAGWGVYISNAWDRAVLDLGAKDPGKLSYFAPGGDADVLLFGPGDPAALLAEYVRITGYQPLPPAWALGYLQSRFGYESFDHVHHVLERFSQEKLPVHAVIFDVQWLEDHVNFRWDPRTFPDPEGNLARIAKSGMRTMVITEPGTRVGASNHAAGAAIGAFATSSDGSEYDSEQWYAQRGIEGYRDIEPSSGALLNVFREEAADWWYDQHRELVQQGVDAWWLDLNEPEDVRADVIFSQVDWPAPRDELSGAQARNLFAIAQQRLFARRDRINSSRRPFVLTRSGSAGSQRYGASPWTGDVGSTWQDLAIHPRLLLNAGLSGFALAGSDVGGFNGDPGEELFVRWMQLGAVSPVFRAHGYMQDREPWSQGKAALDAIRPSLTLRAQLLPSIASWAWRALRSGEQLMRPMLMGPLESQPRGELASCYSQDERFASCDDQFFFGPLLAAPVLHQGMECRNVFLPDTQEEWIDIWSGDRYVANGQSVEVSAPLDRLPLFVRSTDLLIADPDPLDGRGRNWPPAELEAWSWAEDDNEAYCDFYVDDGITRLHEQGAYCLQRVVALNDEVRVERLGGAWPASRIRRGQLRP